MRPRESTPPRHLACCGLMSVPYQIRRSDRARRIRVSVDGNGDVEVVLPRRSPERHAEQAVQELSGWIERRRRAVARAAVEVGRAPGTVPYLGTLLTLVPEAGGSRGGGRAAPGRGLCPLGRALHGADDPRPEDALGLVLLQGRDVVQLAPAARAPG